ncbi:MAG: leucyl/phenylalanyl-tRNA--protein transferase [Pseudobdellovibrionaceae bacterium]
MTPDDLIALYRMGYFPMAQTREDQGFDIVAPCTRALLPLTYLHIPARLKRTIRQRRFEVRVDVDFAAVIHACARAREATWINQDIEELYIKLHQQGLAHSIECWQEGRMVGGLYGVCVGGTFCGESMFSTVSDASKVALVALCARLHSLGYHLLDAQFRNPHLDQFGLYEMSQDDYVAQMQSYLHESRGFGLGGVMPFREIESYIRSGVLLTPCHPPNYQTCGDEGDPQK